MNREDGARRPAATNRTLGLLLHCGTWAASGVVALGLGLQVLEQAAGIHSPVPFLPASIVAAGILTFILLPVARLVLMLAAFVRERDYRFAGLAALVLAIIGLGAWIGAARGPRQPRQQTEKRQAAPDGRFTPASHAADDDLMRRSP